MEIQLHKNARTTPAIRKEIQASKLSEKMLAEKYGLNRATIHKWKNRESIEDKSHRPQNLHSTLNEVQEFIMVHMRRTLLLPLDDLLAVTKEFIHPSLSRSALDRCLRRNGVSNLNSLYPKEEKEPGKEKTFKDYDPGYLHIDVKYLPRMPDEQERCYLFVAIDRATRWVYMEIMKDKSSKSASLFLTNLKKKVPFKITHIITDNGKEFTDRFIAGGERKPTGNHLFDKECKNDDIDHRLIKPRHPQTNGMVERFNGRISDILKTTRFRSSHDLEEVMKRYLRIYNHHIPQKNLGHITPIQSLKDWQKKKPDLFKKRVYNLAGLDNFTTSYTVCRLNYTG